MKVLNVRGLMMALLALSLVACDASEVLPRAKARHVAATPSPTAPVPLSVTPVMFLCGETLVKAVFLDDTAMTVEMGGAVHNLGRVVAASGARYETPKAAVPMVAFWNKGEEATVEINGAALPVCGVAKVTQGAPVTGRVWQVGDINKVAPLPGKILTVSFGDDGRVSGDAGCNRFSGAYTLAGEELVIGPLMSTKMACVDAAMNTQEQGFLALLNEMTRLRTDDAGNMTLTNSNGQQILLSVEP